MQVALDFARAEANELRGKVQAKDAEIAVSAIQTDHENAGVSKHVVSRGCARCVVKRNHHKEERYGTRAMREFVLVSCARPVHGLAFRAMELAMSVEQTLPWNKENQPCEWSM